MWSLMVALVLVAGVGSEMTLCPVKNTAGLRHPTHLLALPGGHWLVSEQPGRILQLTGTERTTVLDLEDRIVTSDSPMEERGLLSFALDLTAVPHIMYVSYSGRSTDPAYDHDLVLAVFRFGHVARRLFQVDPSSEKRLMAIGQPGSERNGGYLFFGPPKDRRLYLTIGSGGGPKETTDRFDLNNLLGKIIRLNVTESTPDGKPPGLEIFAIGFWNPWRCSVDRQPSASEERILCGDVGAGEDNTDVVVDVLAGGVYRCPSDCDAVLETLSSDWNATPQNSLYVHKHEEGQALIGGFVYRGTGMPELQGAYLFGDFVHGSLHALWESKDGGPWTKTDIATDTSLQRLFVLSITTDLEGEPLFLAASDLRSSSATGAIYRLQNSCPGGGAREFGASIILITILFFLPLCTFL